MAIPIGRGLVALIDDVDGYLASIKWHALRRSDGVGFYVIRNAPRNRADRTAGFEFYLHRAVLKPPNGVHVDHKNGDGLDCRRENLRFASYAQNAMNVRRRCAAASSSGFKGVRCATGGRWKAYIKINGKQIHLGVFDSKEDAAAAYDSMAVELFGEFASLNLRADTEPKKWAR